MIYDWNLQLLKLMYLNGLNIGGKKKLYTVKVAQAFTFHFFGFLNLSYLKHFSSIVGNSINQLSVFFFEFQFYFISKNLNQYKENSFQIKKENRYFYMQQEGEHLFSLCKNKSCSAHSSRRVGGQLKFSNTELLIVKKCFYLGENWF